MLSKLSRIKDRISNKIELTLYGGVIRSFQTQEKIVALTFDDGPHPVWTPKLINLLNHYGAKATFFVVGENAQKYPEIIKKAVEAGHGVGNHSWSHPSFPSLTSEEREIQLRKCDELIGKYNPDKLFRPPYGHLDKYSRREVLKQGYKIVIWDLLVNDWESGMDEQTMYEKIVRKMKPGSIILLHDTLFGRAEEDRALILSLVNKILIKFGDEYEFLSIPEMGKLADPLIRYWNFDPS